MGTYKEQMILLAKEVPIIRWLKFISKAISGAADRTQTEYI